MKRSIRDLVRTMRDGDVVIVSSSIGHRVSIVRLDGVTSLVTTIVDACGNESVRSCAI